MPRPKGLSDRPNRAGLCAHDGIPIMFIDRKWRHFGSPEDLTGWRTDPAAEKTNEATSAKAAERHTITPKAGSVTTADVWDIDEATNGNYPNPSHGRSTT